MAISITCDKCATSESVADEWAGKAIVCRKCFAPIVVPAAGDAGITATAPAGTAPTSTRRVRDWGDTEDRKTSIAKPASISLAVVLIVSGVLAASCVLCAGGGGFLWLISVRAHHVAEERAQVAAVDHAEMVRMDAIKDQMDFKGAPPQFMDKGAPPQFMDKGAPPQFMNQGFPGAVQAGKGKIILEQQSRLTPNDARRDGKVHKPFQIRFEQGKTYVIDLRSTEMDPYLILFDPTGLRVAINDDGGGGLNSRIRFMADKTGAYLIAATVFGGAPRPQGAAFTITVRDEDAGKAAIEIKKMP